MRNESGGYRRDHLRALAQRIEVDAKEVRIMGSKSVLLRSGNSGHGAIFGANRSVVNDPKRTSSQQPEAA